MTSYDGKLLTAGSSEDAIGGDVVTLFATGARGGLRGQSPFAVGPIGYDATGIWVNVTFQNLSNVVVVRHLDPSKPAKQMQGVTWRFAPAPGTFIPSFGTAAIEDGNLYAFVYNNTQFGFYRYALADPNGQQPVLVSNRGAWLAGPCHGWNRIERRDEGVFAVRAGTDRIDALQISRSILHVSRTAFDGSMMYLALEDGRVIGVDLESRAETIEIATPCRSWQGIAHAERTLVATCDDRVYVASVR